MVLEGGVFLLARIASHTYALFLSTSEYLLVGGQVTGKLSLCSDDLERFLHSNIASTLKFRCPEEKSVTNFFLNQGNFQRYSCWEEVAQVHFEEKQGLPFTIRHRSSSFGSLLIFCSASAWITLVTAYAVKLCDKMEQKLKLKLCKLPGKGRDLVYWVWMLRPGSSEHLSFSD